MAEKDAVIISFESAKKTYDEKQCNHRRVVIDERLWLIECARCGKQLDPIAYLLFLANEERHWDYRCNLLKEQYQQLKKDIDAKNRVKCLHCGKFTPVVKE